MRVTPRRILSPLRLHSATPAAIVEAALSESAARGGDGLARGESRAIIGDRRGGHNRRRRGSVDLGDFGPRKNSEG